MYCNVWTPVIGKELTLKRKPDNPVNKHAVAVTKDRQIVGHISERIQEQSHTSWLEKAIVVRVRLQGRV